MISQFLDLRNWRYDFCKEAKNLDLNKRKGGKLSVTDSGPHASGSSSSRPRRRSLAISLRRRGIRPNQGHRRDPQSFANRLTPFSLRGATGRGSPSIMAARRRCSALRQSSQAGRARPRVFYSTSGLRRSFLGRRLGLKRRAMSRPRESPTPAETRRRCASCPATVSAVERPPSGANAC